jgi:hypothetical protein
MSELYKATVFVFPHDTLTPITDEPNHTTIELLLNEIYANAAENETTLGGGQNGYLGLIMPTAEYLKVQTDMGITPAIPFIKPTAPTTGDDAITIKRKEQIIVDYKHMELQLKKQIIAAVKAEFLEPLQQTTTGYKRTKSAKEILAYLVTEYDIITQDDLKANRDKLDTPWDASEPIYKLWNRTLAIQRFATAGKFPIPDITIVHALITVLMNTGVFATHIIIWKQKPNAEWTLDNFKKFFNEANKERLLHTAKEAGYANAVKSTTNTNNIGKNDKVNASGTNFDKTYVTLGDKKIYYCWSHGGSTNANHTSLSCNRPKEGHVTNSNWMNTCGGCTAMMISAENKQQRFRNGGNTNYRNNGYRNNNGNNNNGNNNNQGNNGNNNNQGNNGNNNNQSNNSNNNNQSNNSTNNNQSTNNNGN